MKKILACSAALSLMLIACGDDTSSSSNPVSGGDGNSSATELSSGNEVGSSSSVAPGSSATEPESSATAPESSATAGSSASTPDLLRQEASNVFGACIVNNPLKDPLLDGACPDEGPCEFPAVEDAALPPVAYMSIDKQDSLSAMIVVEEVRMPCESISGTVSIIQRPVVEGIEVVASGDTLYVTSKLDEARVESGCVCRSRLVFEIKPEPAFTNASILVVDDKLNRGDRMTIIKENTNETLTQLDTAGFERGQCIGNALTKNAWAQKKSVAKDVAVDDAEEELPVANLVTLISGRTILEVTNVQDYCGIEAKVSQKLVGDTLFLDYYDMEMATKCLCTFDTHTFDIAPENTVARFAKFKDILFRIEEIRYTIDPNWPG